MVLADTKLWVNCPRCGAAVDITKKVSKLMKVNIYIVIVEDRHCDVITYPFTDKYEAVSEAKRIAKEYCRYPEDYQEHDYGRDSGWLFYANYSCEGDCVRVVTAELDKSSITEQ